MRISQEENRTEFNIFLDLDRRATIVGRQEGKKVREI